MSSPTLPDTPETPVFRGFLLLGLPKSQSWLFGVKRVSREDCSSVVHQRALLTAVSEQLEISRVKSMTRSGLAHFEHSFHFTREIRRTNRGSANEPRARVTNPRLLSEACEHGACRVISGSPAIISRVKWKSQTHHFTREMAPRPAGLVRPRTTGRRSFFSHWAVLSQRGLAYVDLISRVKSSGAIALDDQYSRRRAAMHPE